MCLNEARSTDATEMHQLPHSGDAAAASQVPRGCDTMANQQKDWLAVASRYSLVLLQVV